MEFDRALTGRRMIRNYEERPVPRDKLERVAAAAFRAPSAGNSRAVTVLIVTDETTRASIAKLANEEHYVDLGFDPWVSRAPAHIVVSVSEQVYRDRYAEPDKLGPDGVLDWAVPYWWIDAGASMMAVLLAVVDEGLGAGFIGVHSVPDLARLLGLRPDQQPIGVITVGYPAPDRRSSSLDRDVPSRDEMLRWERWDR